MRGVRELAPGPTLGIRWTIGDVSEPGFQALRLSIWGAWRLFGSAALYCVCVNTVALARARALTGAVPDAVRWRRSQPGDLPAWLRREFLEREMAEGTAWKFAPPRIFPEFHELSLDNDVVLWREPAAVRAWLEDAPAACLIAEDVRACFGQFAVLCGPEPRNSGIRGLPPRFDMAAALRAVLRERPARLVSETDEQGLQVAALSCAPRLHVVRVEDVSICSPFPPHQMHLGRCGAHFVGLNTKALPWSWEGRSGERIIWDHWDGHRRELHERLGLALAA